MHEFSICRSLVEAIIEEYEALDPPATRLKAARVISGGMHQIVPEYMQNAYQLLTQDSVVAGSVLDLQIQPVIGCCRQCGWQGKIIPPFFQCGACEALAIDVVQGQELYLDRLEVEFD